MKHKLFALFSLGSAAFLGTWVGVQVAQREIPTTIYAAEPTNPIVARGTDLRVAFALNRNRSCAVTADQFIYDKLKTRFMLPDLEIKAGLKLGDDQFTLLVPVPENAEPGPALFVINPNYICNATQRIWPIAPERPTSVSFIIK